MSSSAPYRDLLTSLHFFEYCVHSAGLFFPFVQELVASRIPVFPDEHQKHDPGEDRNPNEPSA